MDNTYTHNLAYTKTPTIAEAFGFTDVCRDSKAHPEIPSEVIQQLREAGINIMGLNAGELRDAHLSFLADGVVIDEHHADNFRDALSLMPDEAKEGRGRSKHNFWQQRIKAENDDLALALPA